MGAATSLLITAAWAAIATKLSTALAATPMASTPILNSSRTAAGNLYGTSVQGGVFGGGTVFQVTPAGVHTVLYDFTGGADGGEPYKGVTLDAQGNLYGTAVTGGGGSCEGGCGVVFKLIEFRRELDPDCDPHIYRQATARDPGARSRSTRTAIFLARHPPAGLKGWASSIN